MSHKPFEPVTHRLAAEARRQSVVIEPVLRRNFCASSARALRIVEVSICDAASQAVSVDGHRNCTVEAVENCS